MTQPAIVFIHGAGISSWMWRQQIEGITAFSTVALDLPGHRKSPRPWTSVAAAAAAVAETIRTQVPGGKAHVVGLSLGGVVALQLLAQEPEAVDRMLISGTLATGLPGAGFLAGLTARTLPLATMGPLVRLSARMLAVPKEDYPRLMADVRRLEAGPLRQMILDVARFRPPPVLATRPHQVLVVAGSKEHPRIRQSVTALAALMPNGRGALVPGGLHTWHWQFPDRFNALVLAWFRTGLLGDFLIQST